jgi:tRNA 5-methylaminomethyl-2-thiouridine biosynthesis bifunctional protein
MAHLPGLRRVLQADGAVTLDLLHAPPDAALAQLAARIDAVRLHGTAEAGTGLRARGQAAVARRGARCARPGAPQTAALAATGWTFGDAWPARYASRKPFAAVPPAPVRRAIVIGAGLAGAAACERLCARGWHVTLVERHAQAATEASGNLAGISMPLLSKDDNIASRLSRAAFLFALGYWDRLGGVGAAIEGAPCGVLWVARDAAHARLQRAAAARAFRRRSRTWLEAQQAAARFGPLAPHGAWLFPQGAWIRPASACQAMLDACGPRLQRRFGAGSVTLERGGGQWRVTDAAGALIAEAPTVIVANGAGATGLAQAATLPLIRVRGQVTHLTAAALPELGVVLCREAYIRRRRTACAAPAPVTTRTTIRRCAHRASRTTWTRCVRCWATRRWRWTRRWQDGSAFARWRRTGCRWWARCPIRTTWPAPNGCASCRARAACTACWAMPRAG